MAAQGWAPAQGMGRSPIENTGETGAGLLQVGTAAERGRQLSIKVPNSPSPPLMKTTSKTPISLK